MAVEAAYQMPVRRRLVVLETNDTGHGGGDGTEGRREDDAMDVDTGQTAIVADEESEGSDFWSQELPILSPGTRTFGMVQGDRRLWAQKTVKLKDVMRRWCVFGALPGRLGVYDE